MTACADADTSLCFIKEISQKNMTLIWGQDRYKTLKIILPRKYDLFNASLKKIERKKKTKETDYLLIKLGLC